MVLSLLQSPLCFSCSSTSVSSSLQNPPHSMVSLRIKKFPIFQQIKHAPVTTRSKENHQFLVTKANQDESLQENNNLSKPEYGEAGSQNRPPPSEQQQQPTTNSSSKTTASANGKGDDISELGSEIRKAMKEREQQKEGDLWSGVAEEIREIEWPAFNKVLGTTGVVLGVIAGSSVVLLTFNAILAELSDRVFAGRGIQDFFG